LLCQRELLQESAIFELGGNTRKFRKIWPHHLAIPVEGRKRAARCRPIRSLFAAVAGVLLLTGAFVPRADAVLAAYFNFEDTTTGATIGGLGGETPLSRPPAIQTGIPLNVSVSGLPQPTSTQGVNLNVAPGDPDTNLHGMGFVTTTGGAATFSFTVSTIGLSNLSLSFAVDNNGNGFNLATASYSINGGAFTTFGDQPILTGKKTLVTFDFSSVTAINDKSSVTFSVMLSGGTSMGSNLQTIVDNIQLAEVPEPATTASGALAVLGLCWFQRRRLIRFLRLRRA